MPISFRNLDVGKKLQKDLAFTQDDLRYAAERQRDRIVKRTGQGLDLNGNAFHAYTDKYKARKEKSGRDSGIVDLTWSGRMLKALKVSNVSDSAHQASFTLGIYGEEGVRGAVHDAGLGKMPQRKFVGANNEDRSAISKDVTARMRARANGTPLNS
jgi:phage gpG-like protein